MIFFSPAKINIFFRVVAKRRDGYHDIASLYSALDYGDFLDINISEEDSFSCSDARLKTDPSNLVIKALKIFRSKLQIDTPVAIHLEKNIPIQAGLGGGSSNAATTLWALNELFKRPLSLKDLIEIGAIIGSDVPFFFSSGNAYCHGRGEIFENAPPFTNETIWIAIPDFLRSSTPKVYGDCHPGEMSQVDPKDLLNQFLENRWEPINDLQPAAFRQVPGLQAAYEKLQISFKHAALTGSGSAFYAIGKKTSSLPSSFNFIMAKTISRESDDWYLPYGKKIFYTT
jgi:4-diphosphocytidyl-2-C-methyl-D-erythritol kinase